MRDLGKLLDHESTAVDLAPDAFEGLLRRRDRKQLRERVTAAVLVLVLVVGFAAAALSALRLEEVPAAPDLNSGTVGSLQTLWTGDIGGVVSPPAVGDGIVVAANTRGHIVAFAADCAVNGSACSPLWYADVGPIEVHHDRDFLTPGWAGRVGPPNGPEENSAVTIVDGTVYTVAKDGTVFAFATDCATGGSMCQPLWTAAVSGIGPLPQASNGTTFVATTDGVWAFDERCAMNGSACAPLWRADGQWLRVQDGHVYVTDPARGTASELDPATGVAIWTGGPGTCCGNTPTPVRFGDTVYVDFGAELEAFPAACRGSCTPSWVGDIPDAFSSGPVVAGDAVFLTVATDTEVGGVLSFPVDCATEGATCTTSHRADVPGELTTWGPVVSNGLVMAVSARASGVFAFDPACVASWNGCEPAWSAAVLTPDQPVTGGDVAFVADEGTGSLNAFPAGCVAKRVVGAPGMPQQCLPVWQSDYIPVGPPAIADAVVFSTDMDGVVHASGLPTAGTPQTGNGGRPSASVGLAYGFVALVAAGWLAWALVRRRRLAAPRSANR